MMKYLHDAMVQVPEISNLMDKIDTIHPLLCSFAVVMVFGVLFGAIQFLNWLNEY